MAGSPEQRRRRNAVVVERSRWEARLAVLQGRVESLEAENERLKDALQRIRWGGKDVVTETEDILTREQMQDIARIAPERKEA